MSRSSHVANWLRSDAKGEVSRAPSFITGSYLASDTTRACSSCVARKRCSIRSSLVSQ